jgi:hypothetical protein
MRGWSGYEQGTTGANEVMERRHVGSAQVNGRGVCGSTNARGEATGLIGWRGGRAQTQSVGRGGRLALGSSRLV